MTNSSFFPFPWGAAALAAIAVLLLLPAGAGAAGCREDSGENPGAGAGRPQHLPSVTLQVAGHPVTAEVASSPEERAKGLMFRRSLPENRGMLFVFEQERRPGFYMRNTLIPLSIAYIAKDGTIREIRTMKPLSEAVIKSRRAVLYALEMNRGWFARHGVDPGDTVEIPGELIP